MIRFAQVARFAVLVALVGLSGCFNYTEEIRIDEKGAGKLTFVFERGEQGVIEKTALALWGRTNPFDDLEKLQKDLPAGVKPVGFKSEMKDKRKFVYGGYEFDDLSKLAQWAKTNKIEPFETINLVKAGDTWAFTRSLRAKDAGELEDAKKKFIGSHLIFKLTGPGKLVAEESNPKQVENNNTCVWEGSFPDLLEGKGGQGTEMKAQYFIGIPMWIKAAIGAVVLVIVVAVAAVALRKKPAAPAAAA